MSEPFVGEIRIFGFNFAPRGWAFCNGALIAVQQNAALFALIGTTYGGNGTTNFALPNLQSRFPLCMGTGAGLPTFVQGQLGGSQQSTILPANLPAHAHALTPANAKLQVGAVNSAAGTTNPVGSALAIASGNTYVSGATPNAILHPGSVSYPGSMTDPTGGNVPLQTISPYLVLNFCIATVGLFPTRN